MIEINDNNREDLIASCLMEAANVMTESYGKNGLYGKALEERYKTVKSKNDALRNKLGSKAFIDTDEEYQLKRAIEKDKRIKQIPNRSSSSQYGAIIGKHNRSDYAKMNYHEKAEEMTEYGRSNSAAKGVANRLSNNINRSQHASYYKRKANEKINKRAMNESIDLTNTILDLLD